MNYYDQVQEAAQYIVNRINIEPKVGVVLGTGLGDFTDAIVRSIELSYEEIPYFPKSTVQSHKGKFIFGYINNVPTAVMAGRFHYYEGYSMREVTFPIRVLKALGIQTIIITNVAGSVNENMNAGDIVIIKDHINLMPDNPLRGANDDRWGIRFPDMLHAYSPHLIQKALTIMQSSSHPTHVGVYAALPGPNLETPAEYNFLHVIGADIVGMSSVPEVIVAKHADLDILAISVVSNKCYPVDTISKTTLESVIEVAQKAGHHLRKLIVEVIGDFST